MFGDIGCQKGRTTYNENNNIGDFKTKLFVGKALCRLFTALILDLLAIIITTYNYKNNLRYFKNELFRGKLLVFIVKYYTY